MKLLQYILPCVLVFMFGPLVAKELDDDVLEYRRINESLEPVADIKTAERAVFQAERTSSGSDELARLSVEYGLALLKNNKPSLAFKYFEKSYEFYRAVYGAESPRLVKPLLAMAKSRLEDRRYRRSRVYNRYITRALKVAESVGGKDSKIYAETLLESGKILLDVPLEPMAEKRLAESYSLFSARYPYENARYYFSSLLLGILHLVRKEFVKAEPLLLESVQIVTKHLGEGSDYEVMARSFLVELYENTGNDAAATRQSQEIGKSTDFILGGPLRPIYLPLSYSSHEKDFRNDDIVVAFTVSAKGQVENIIFRSPNESEHFHNKVKRSLKRARFAPRYVEGKPVATHDQEMRVPRSALE